ncbi:MAG: hypothetical protein JST80_05050 [Bdellovibrionales bacterium]|nr:hypothetical protein [Bdellovibrionales bacterium]
MAHLHKDNILKLSSGLIIVGLFMIRHAYRKYRLRRLIEDMATSKVASAAQGFVELQGTAYALAGNSHTAMRGRKVAYVEIEVQKWLKSGKNHRWITQFSATLGDRFVLRDASGYAHVLTKGGEMEFNATTYPWESLAIDDQNDFIQNVMPKITKANPMVLSDGRWRMSERIVAIGTPVYALGTFSTRSMEPEVDIETEDGKTQKVAPSGGLMKRSAHPLILSDCRQEDLLKRIGDWHVAKMIIAAGMIAFGIYLLVHELHIDNS